MGIYYGNEIYGVRIVNPENTKDILYEAIYKQRMSEDELKLFFITYDEYANKKTYIPLISIYIGMTSAYDSHPKSEFLWLTKNSLQDLKDFL